MIYPKIIQGKTVILRPVQEEDAEFIIQLRQAEEIRRYLHTLDITVEAEREWIRKHNALEGDYNFIICDKTEKPVGMISLYNIHDGEGEPGRLASFGSAPQNIEACLLINDIGFEEFGLNRMVGCVVAQNTKVISMQQKIGFVFNDKIDVWDNLHVRFAKLERAEYMARRNKLYEKVYKASRLTQV